MKGTSPAWPRRWDSRGRRSTGGSRSTGSSPIERIATHPAMTLRAKIIVYLVLIHAVLAGISFVVLREDRLWLLAVEGLFALSIGFGVMLVRTFFVPLDLIRTGAELIGERDFTSQFREVGQPEMDALIRIYNRMIDRLREERLKLQEQHFFLEKILAASPAGIAALDFDGRNSSLNPAAEALPQVSGTVVNGLEIGAL